MDSTYSGGKGRIGGRTERVHQFLMQMGRYLLDTNIVAFLIHDSGDVCKDVLGIMEDYGNQIVICGETIKELYALYRHDRFMQRKWSNCSEMIHDFCSDFGVSVSYSAREHYDTMLHLEWNEAEQHHDPSDLLIIAHAITERLTLVSSDRKFAFYRSQGLRLVENKR